MRDQATNEIALGAVVELRSGGTPMTVRKIKKGRVECIWFKNGEVKGFSFERHCVQPSTQIKTHEDRLAELEAQVRDND